MTTNRARQWHALTAVVATAALVLQLVLVIQGDAILVDNDPPGLAARLYRFCAYFTIESNLLIAIASLSLCRDPARDGRGWRVLRLAGIVGITVTGLVHFLLLRPLLDLDGLDLVADKMLHMVVPVLAVLGWAVFGPRPRVTRREIGLALAFPISWLAWTLVFGAVDGWYPYPFLDPDEHSWGAVILTCLGITTLFLVRFGAASWVDRLSAAQPREG